MSLCVCSQIILPIMLPYLIPWHFSWYFIPHVLALFMGLLLLLVCWILFQRKNIHLLWFVPWVMRCRMHLNICGESFCLFYILLLRLVVMRCNSIIVIPSSGSRRSGWTYTAMFRPRGRRSPSLLITSLWITRYLQRTISSRQWHDYAITAPGGLPGCRTGIWKGV